MSLDLTAAAAARCARQHVGHRLHRPGGRTGAGEESRGGFGVHRKVCGHRIIACELVRHCSTFPIRLVGHHILPFGVTDPGIRVLPCVLLFLLLLRDQEGTAVNSAVYCGPMGSSRHHPLPLQLQLEDFTEAIIIVAPPKDVHVAIEVHAGVPRQVEGWGTQLQLMPRAVVEIKHVHRIVLHGLNASAVEQHEVPHFIDTTNVAVSRRGRKSSPVVYMLPFTGGEIKFIEITKITVIFAATKYKHRVVVNDASVAIP
mmetsp:Transcript_125415/g.217442  ORF Transcript_125415/g.217442 Transcript_125415/m.217442 type:complete len:257 (+) Transcript_125415:93-863(+)